MDGTKFFNVIRQEPFGGTLSQSQVDGINRLFNVWNQFYSHDPVEFLAYDLATSFLETGRAMQPVTEEGSVSYFNKYEPGTPLGKALGNTEKGDGYRFRGEGDVQNTGRRNASFASHRLNAMFSLGIDLVANPNLRLDPVISAHSLFLGNREGWWTGRKLGDYIAPPNNVDFVGARHVVNGTDKAQLIAGYAEQFLNALRSADA